MASSSGNTNPQNPAFDFRNFFKPSPSLHPTPPASYPPPSAPFQYHQHLYMPPPQPLGGELPSQPQEAVVANLQHQRSLSYSTPPLNPPSPRSNHNPGTHILALLNNSDVGGNGNTTRNQDLPPQNLAGPHTHEISRSCPAPIRVPSCNLPKGRHLVGDYVVYDVDARLQGEVQLQLEVTPITKYGSDPQLVVGRQIAVNNVYICYGLKGGNVRVLNINTALRSLFRGHAQRVSDMAFFAEDVHLLASVSTEGRIFVWKISEGSEGGDEPQIAGRIVLAVQILGEEEAKHPRVCWHCHKQEILVVALGKHVVRIDTTKVGKGEAFSAEKPLQCHLDKLIDGIQLVGKHDGEVTDLSMCQWMSTRLVSSSVDGTIKIWEDCKAQPLAVLRPHDGFPVNSATFLTASERPDHIILITGGPLNREMKIWVSANEEGWLLPNDAESWKCIQALDLISSAEPRAEAAFFNQVVALSQAGLLLIANAKRNAIYAVHLDYGPCPVQTRMDYIAEFTVTMPILSFTGTNGPLDEHVVKVYCVQTQAIQQYTLDLCQCLPPPVENASLEESDSSVSRKVTSTEGFSASDPREVRSTELPLSDSVPKQSVQASSPETTNAIRYPVSAVQMEAPSQASFISSGEPKTSMLASACSDGDTVYVPSPHLPLSPRLSRELRAPKNSFDVEPAPQQGGHSEKNPVIDFAVDMQMDTTGTNFSDVPSLDDNSKSDGKKVALDDVASMCHPPRIFKHPTHLVTPSEILMAVSSTDATSSSEGKGNKDANIEHVNTNVGSIGVEVKEASEARSSQNDEIGYCRESQNPVSESREKIFCSQASGLSIDMARECHAVSEDNYAAEESELHGQCSIAEEEESLDSRSVSVELPESVLPSAFPQSTTSSNKAKKQKGKNSQGKSSPSLSSFNLADSNNEKGQSSSFPTADSSPHILALQKTINQLMASQKEMQRQFANIVNTSVTKEGKRLETALGRNLEKVCKANADALWARMRDEFVKNEKLLCDRTQQIANAMENLLKEMNAMSEKMVAAIVPAVARAITPSVEKAVASAIADSFQRGVADKVVNQLDKSVNSKLEATVARQIQAQFQTSGRQALQDALKSSLEASLVPAFEMSCKTMFEQIDATFHKGIAEHTNAALQHFESTHSQLALALRESIGSASSVAQTLSRELVDGQRKLLALAAAGASSGAANPLVTQMSNGPLGGLLEKVETPLDPMKELSRLISERNYEEAFTSALQRSDVSFVSWLCSQVDMHGILATVPLPLSQGVLLALLQQLACDINKDTPRKLAWMTDVVAAINPADETIAVHARPVLEQVYKILHHKRSSSPVLSGGDLSSIRLLMLVINSMLVGRQ